MELSRSHRRRAGFSLIELMVSLAIGGLTITSMYAIGSATTRSFRHQEEIGSLQTSLRTALEQVKRDIARAGYLSTPNAQPVTPLAPAQTCAPVVGLSNPGALLAGISGFANNVPTPAGSGVDPTGNNAANGFTVDEVTLIGNYETSSQYGGVQLGPTNNPGELTFSPNTHDFRRDFTFWYQGGAPANNASITSIDVQGSLAEAFTPGRLVRIQTTGPLKHFAVINTAPALVQGAGTNVQISIVPAVPNNCVPNLAGGWIAPVSVIRYRVVDAPAPPSPAPASPYGPHARLVREEMDPSNRSALLPPPNAGAAPRRREILDFVVGFNLQFTFNTATLPNNPDVYTIGNWQVGNVNTAPESIRAVSINLAVRTPTQDPALPFIDADGNPLCGNRRCYQVFTWPGRASVRELRAEVFLPNLAQEGY